MKAQNFSNLIDFFPELELPITLTEESSFEFSKINKPLSESLITEYLLPYEEIIDEFTEIIPCFRIQETGKFHAIIYWKASLMTYEYKLVTFDNQGKFISGKVIAGTISNGETIIRTVATIDEDWIIHTVVGEHSATKLNNITTDSQAFTLELLATGDIIFSLNEDFDE